MIAVAKRRLAAGVLCALQGAAMFAQDAAASAPALREPDWEAIAARFRPRIERAWRLAESRPKDAEAAGALAMTLQALGRYESAEAAYRRALALDPAAFRFAYYLGTVLQARNRGAEAIEVIEGALGVRGDCPPCRTRLGDLLRGAGDLEAAEKQYRLALERAPELASVLYGQGRVYAARNDWAAAAERYERACAAAKNYGAAYYALGLAYRKLGEKEKARTALNRFERLRPLPAPTFDPMIDALNALHGERRPAGGTGRALTRRQRETLAEELERALRANPELVSAEANLITLYWELGDAAKAERHYHQAIAIEPGYADAHYAWGRARMARGEAAAAERLFEKALKADPDHVDALVESGLLLERTGRAEKAEKRYRRALEVDPVYRQANYLLARRLMRLGRYAEAAGHLEETIRIEDASTPGYMRALASIYVQSGDREKAVSYLRQARERSVSLELEKLTGSIDSDLSRLGASAEAR